MQIMPEKYIYHLTLSTGHARQSPRAEVRDDVIAALRPVVESALSGSPVPIEQCPGYRLKAKGMGSGCALFRVLDDGGEVVTFGVAGKSRCAGRLWQAMGQGADEKMPSMPWCAVRFGPELMRGGTVEWLGDFERCVAWTFLENVTRATLNSVTYCNNQF